jgi:hypothetical protein
MTADELGNGMSIFLFESLNAEAGVVTGLKR